MLTGYYVTVEPEKFTGDIPLLLGALTLAASALSRPELPALPTNAALCCLTVFSCRLTGITHPRLAAVALGAHIVLPVFFAGAWSMAGAALSVSVLRSHGGRAAFFALLAWPVLVAVFGRLFVWLLVIPEFAPVGFLFTCLSVAKSEHVAALSASCRHALARAVLEVDDPTADAVMAPLGAPLHAAPPGRAFAAGDVVVLSPGYAAYDDAMLGPLAPRALGLVQVQSPHRLHVVRLSWAVHMRHVCTVSERSCQPRGRWPLATWCASRQASRVLHSP